MAAAKTKLQRSKALVVAAAASHQRVDLVRAKQLDCICAPDKASDRNKLVAFSIPIICSSENRALFIVCPSFRPDPNYSWRKTSGSCHRDQGCISCAVPPAGCDSWAGKPAASIRLPADFCWRRSKRSSIWLHLVSTSQFARVWFCVRAGPLNTHRRGSPVRSLRRWLMRRLGIRDNAAADGEWWEIDLILTLLFGAFLAGGAAWFAL